MNTLLLEHADGKTRTALVRDGKLFRFEEEDGAHPRAEEIYYAKTDRCMPGMECVFVHLDAKTSAYLPYREMRGTPVPPKGGTGLIVQVKRSPVREKLAYVTMDVSLVGRYAILLPGSARSTVSARTPEGLREAAEKRASSLRPEGFGLVLRSEGMEAEEETIRQEIGELADTWASVKAQGNGGEPRLLFGRPTALERYLRDTKGGVDRVLSDVPLSLPVPCEVREAPMALYNVTGQWEKAQRRLHHLPGGGNIVIDPCEAMTVIDVNSAMDTGSRRGAEEARTRVNLEAAREIARLLQLRAVGGIILIDFIDMDRENNRAAVKAELEKALETDPCKTVLHGFTSLGLMEMTRKKS